MRRLISLTIALVAVAAWMIPSSFGGVPSDTPDVQHIRFQNQVANIEYTASGLTHASPPSARQIPQITGQAWFGVIMRRLPGDSIRDERHYVSIATEYLGGQVQRAWCDQNLDGDLTNDGEVALLPYPGLDGAKSFLVDLGWSVEHEGRKYPIQWKVRVVLEPALGAEARPYYRVQRVFAPMGTVVLNGATHRAFLFDGNGDGLYTNEPLDGLFVDLNDDRHFEVDPLDAEFGAFRVPVQWGRHDYEIDPLDPQGTQVALRVAGSGPPTTTARVGEPVPNLTLKDVDGHRCSLADYRGRALIVYFWASWCGVCRKQASDLVELYLRYPREKLEILGVSYDSQLAEMQGFRREHGESWPSTFSSGVPSEDPAGRAFKESGAGVFYLIDRAGYLRGVFYDVGSLSSALQSLPEQ